MYAMSKKRAKAKMVICELKKHCKNIGCPHHKKHYPINLNDSGLCCGRRTGCLDERIWAKCIPVSEAKK